MSKTFKIGNKTLMLDKTRTTILDQTGTKVGNLFHSKTKGIFFIYNGKRVYVPKKIEALSLSTVTKHKKEGDVFLVKSRKSVKKSVRKSRKSSRKPRKSVKKSVRKSRKSSRKPRKSR